MNRRSTAWAVPVAMAVAAALVTACGGGGSSSRFFPVASAPPASTQPEALNDLSLKTMSSPANFVTGGAALMQVAWPEGVSGGPLTATVNGQKVTTDFVPGPASGTLLGVLSALPEGASEVAISAVDADGRTHTGKLAIRSASKTNGVLVAPLPGWICRTQDFGLAPAIDADCNAPTKYNYLYKSTDPAKSALLAYDPAHPPLDVAKATNDQGVVVPFIVRNERGVINRWIYDIAVLFDPSHAWSATAPQPAWNHKVLWRFGGGCTPGHVQSANSAQAVDNAYGALEKGFAVATSGGSVLANHCNTTLSAETVLTVKSHLAVNYGYIRYTLSDGSSGGSIQQHAIANNYPGLLDGIIMAGTSFPDGIAIGTEFADCRLLRRYFASAPGIWGSAAEQAAVMGKPDLSTCNSVDSNFFGLGASFSDLVYDPGIGCTFPDNAAPPTFKGVLPAPGVYDPLANPRGIRCTYFDSLIAIFGKRPSDGFANRSFDNVGVQYGLSALKAGTISMAQFIDLNQRIGGITIDNIPQGARSVADAPALSAAYRSGQVIDGRALGGTPIIAYQSYNNQIFHDTFYNWSVRARLQAVNGTAANQVIWTFAGSPGSFVQDAFVQMDKWLSAIEADSTDSPLAAKVSRARPAATVDACLIAGARVTDVATCVSTYPNFSDPRIAAGADLRDDVLKCQLKPAAASDYGVALTAQELAQIQAVFPDGVCDYGKAGEGQQPVTLWSAWL